MTHDAGSVMDMSGTAERLMASASRLMDASPWAGGHTHAVMPDQHAELRYIRELGARERLAARKWLRQHVNKMRKELGQPTVEQEALQKLRVTLLAATKKMSVEMAKLERNLDAALKEKK